MKALGDSKYLAQATTANPSQRWAVDRDAEGPLALRPPHPIDLDRYRQAFSVFQRIKFSLWRGMNEPFKTATQELVRFHNDLITADQKVEATYKLTLRALDVLGDYGLVTTETKAKLRALVDSHGDPLQERINQLEHDIRTFIVSKHHPMELQRVCRPYEARCKDIKSSLDTFFVSLEDFCHRLEIIFDEWRCANAVAIAIQGDPQDKEGGVRLKHFRELFSKLITSFLNLPFDARDDKVTRPFVDALLDHHEAWETYQCECRLQPPPPWRDVRTSYFPSPKTRD